MRAKEEEEQLREKLARAMDGELFFIEGELTSAFRNGDSDWLWPSWSMAVDRAFKGVLGDTAAAAAPAKGKLRVRKLRRGPGAGLVGMRRGSPLEEGGAGSARRAAAAVRVLEGRLRHRRAGGAALWTGRMATGLDA
eukprot:7991123-Alexandrium_andersonii.AAC.1